MTLRTCVAEHRLHCRSFAWIVLLLLCVGWAAASAQPPAATTDGPQKPERRDGLVYTQGNHGDLLADLYLPADGKTLRPGVVFVHGGAWKSGDRSQMQDLAMFLADKGYVGMAIDYDLTSRGDRFPVALQEAERAVAWLRQHAAAYGVDPRRIAVAGSSAGGELAALIALRPHPAQDSQVQAAIILNGVLDLSYVGPDAEEMVVPYLGGSCGERAALCREASPVFQVHAAAPPFFVGHGTEDRIVPYSQAEHFIAALRAHHVPVTPFAATGAGHTYWKNPQWYWKDADAILAFLKQAMPNP